ncbi:MAG: hypothetical protein GF411_16575 [Candidatus Lokiarchaeota archaeon]|nr:hypothetical protein [Candidatus Lokiarchaeota archaeon]
MARRYKELLDCPADNQWFKRIQRALAFLIWRFVHIKKYTKIYVLEKSGRDDEGAEIKRSLLEKNPIFLGDMTHIQTLVLEFMYIPDYPTVNYATNLMIQYGNTPGLEHFQALGYLFKGIVQYRTGDYEKSIANIKKALQLSCENRDLQAVVRSMFSLAQIHYSQNEMAKAVVLFKKCIERNKSLGNFNKLLATYSELSAAYLALGKYKSARKLIEFCLQHEKRLDQDNIAFLYYDLSELQMMTGNLVDARSALERCASAAKRAGNTVMQYAAMSLQSRLEEFSGNLSKAIELLRKSIDLQKELGTTEVLIDNMCQLVHLYILQNDLNRASDTLLAIELNPNISSIEEFEAQQKYYRAELAQSQDKHEEALEILDEVEEIFQDLDDTLMLTLIQLTRVESFVALKRIDEADEKISEIIKNAIENGAKVSEIRGRIIQSALYLRNHDLRKARSSSELAIKAARTAGYETFAEDAHDIMTRIGNLESALSHYDEVDRIQEDTKKDEISLDDIKAYIARAKSIASAVDS